MLKEQIQHIRERREGFTLAELLIVVAIIMVLVAIAIPVFTDALHNAQDAVDVANSRSVYAELQADYLANMSEYYPEEAVADVATDGSSITFGDGEKVEMNNCTVTATFKEGVGWYVTCTCPTDGVLGEWGPQ